MSVTKEHEHKRNIGIKSDNRGFTLTEMLVTFALLGIFLVAVTRMISYTVTLYHETQGAALGMQVNDMIATKIQGVVENSTAILDDWHYLQLPDMDTSRRGFWGSGDDFILLQDANGLIVEIRKEPVDAEGNGYIVIKYDPVEGDEESGGYDAYDWKFDEKAYMGYMVKSIRFAEAEKMGDYGPNVIYMQLTIISGKYGEYTSEYYMRASKVRDRHFE